MHTICHFNAVSRHQLHYIVFCDISVYLICLQCLVTKVEQCLKDSAEIFGSTS